jgi:hypothetical protein
MIVMNRKLILFSIFLFWGMISVKAADLQNFSWSSTNTTPGANAVMTFSYQIVTANPVHILYAIPDFGKLTFNAVNSITVNGTSYPFTQAGITWACRVALDNPALATAGANIVVSVNVTNSSFSGFFYWTFIHTANGGGGEIDGARNISPLLLGVPTTTAASSISCNGFVANWSGFAGSTDYFLDVSTSNSFSSYVSGYQNLNVGGVTSKSITGLAFGTYYYRVRAYSLSITTDNSNAQTVLTDTSVPTIATLSAISVNEDAGVCTYASSQLTAPTTSDNCSVASVVASPASLIPGANTVTWTVTDASGLTATSTQTVTVIDTQNPTIATLSAISVNEDTGVCTYASSQLTAPTVADNCSVVSVIASPASLVAGANTVTWTVTDASGLTATSTQTVTVIDTQSDHSNIVCNKCECKCRSLYLC